MLIWRVASTDGASGRPDGWTGSGPGDRRHGGTTFPAGRRNPRVVALKTVCIVLAYVAVVVGYLCLVVGGVEAAP